MHKLNEDGTCPNCGRDYKGDITIATESGIPDDGLCTSDDCTRHPNRYYKFGYENVSNKAVNELEALFSARPNHDEICISHADSSFMVVIIRDGKTDHEAALYVRNEIWKRNRGYCASF